MVFLNAFGSILSLIIIVLIGYILSRLGWFDEKTKIMIPNLITNVALPPYLAYTIITSFPKDHGNLLIAMEAPFLILLVMFIIAFIFAKLARVNKSNFGLFCASVAISNTIYIGIPVNLALFGSESLPYVLFYYLASMVFFWTIGNYFISRDIPFENERKISKKRIEWRKIISPPIIGFMAGITILLFKMPVPEFVMQTASLIGQLVTPLALIFIGISLEKTGLGNIRPDRDILFALIGKLICTPLLALIIIPFFDLPRLMGNVYIIQSALPVIMQIPILSAYYGTNPRFGAIIVILSTLLCTITVPLWMILL